VLLVARPHHVRCTLDGEPQRDRLVATADALHDLRPLLPVEDVIDALTDEAFATVADGRGMRWAARPSPCPIVSPPLVRMRSTLKNWPPEPLAMNAPSGESGMVSAAAGMLRFLWRTSRFTSHIREPIKRLWLRTTGDVRLSATTTGFPPSSLCCFTHPV
jgi:hypothetical protein